MTKDAIGKQHFWVSNEKVELVFGQEIIKILHFSLKEADSQGCWLRHAQRIKFKASDK